jgi:hypothetical protein
VAEKPRILQNSCDLAMTLVHLIALCLLVFFASGNCSRTTDQVPGVAPKPLAQVAAGTVGFPVRLPGGPDFVNDLPSGWKVSASRTESVESGKQIFSLSYVTDDKRLVQLAQSQAPADQVIAKLGGSQVQTGTVPVGNTTWKVYGEDDKHRTAWSTTLADSVTLVLYGNGTVPQFQTIAEATQDQQPLPSH